MLAKFKWRWSKHRPAWYRIRDLRDYVVPLDKVVAEYCRAHDIPLTEMLSHRRQARLAKARQELMCYLRDTTTASFMEIAKALHRDHTTVLYGVRKHRDRVRQAA